MICVSQIWGKCGSLSIGNLIVYVPVFKIRTWKYTEQSWPFQSLPYHLCLIQALYQKCFSMCTWPSEVWNSCKWLICIFDLRQLKWVKRNKFPNLGNATTNISTTDQHSSKWSLLRCHSKCYKCFSFTFCSWGILVRSFRCCTLLWHR